MVTRQEARGRSRDGRARSLESYLLSDPIAEGSTTSVGVSPGARVSTTSRFVSSMRKSFAPKREVDPPTSVMYSTAAESRPLTPSPYHFPDETATHPTVEQIAMGLHISRTPHLRTSPHHGHTRQCETASVSNNGFISGRRKRGSIPSLPPSPPPPPTRSSLKKSNVPITPSSLRSTSPSDASLSTFTSTAPSTPRSSRSTILSGPLLSKLFVTKKLSQPSSHAVVTSSDDDSGSSMLTPRKAVRFSAGMHNRTS